MTNKTKKIAIVGRIASGKSYFLNTLASLGYKTINMDEYVLNIYQNDLAFIKLIQCSIGEFLIKDGRISKQVLKDWLALDYNNFETLERLLYPYLKTKLLQETFDFVEIPILFTQITDFSDLFDEIWNMSICPKKRKEFVNKRFVEKSFFEYLDKKNNYKWTKNEFFRNKRVVNIPMRSRDTKQKIMKILQKYK
ncbi:dephospho-CoA kinase [Mycoplasma sp. 394]